MKALLFKEFKLAMHPLCWLFILIFPFMVLIPSYPLAIGFIYVLTSYPILFLGANKGQQSNDLLFSSLLPVRKKDIVLARIILVVILQSIFIILIGVLSPLASYLSTTIHPSEQTGEQIPGLPMSGMVSIISIAIVGFALADLIFFPIYYKKGKSIVASTILMIFGFVAYIAIFTIVIPFIPGAEGYQILLCESGIGIQFVFLACAIIISIIIHFIVYRISSKKLEKVDF